MLRSLTLLAAAAALAGILAHAVRAEPGGLDGTVHPHQVQIVVSGADEVSTVRYESGADGAADAGMKVIVRRAVHEGDAAGATTLRRDCPRERDGGGAHGHPLTPMLRS
ncbi:MAG TPA: hypothetical protein VGB24_03195 [Longimicrobium sp.]|jgi:hypothetical protein|uniref:hypothetical protein n=1 Tax=Longimicrobium sp. TaxID=2029185 RepID=UPI002EDAECBD